MKSKSAIAILCLLSLIFIMACGFLKPSSVLIQEIHETSVVPVMTAYP